MNLDATIKQLRQEIEHLKATLSILENLQRQQRGRESPTRTAQRDSAAGKKKPERLRR